MVSREKQLNPKTHIHLLAPVSLSFLGLANKNNLMDDYLLVSVILLPVIALGLKIFYDWRKTYKSLDSSNKKRRSNVDKL